MDTDQLYDVFNNTNGVCIDSRNIIPGGVFFALSGENFDGNKFARDAIDKGAKHAVIDNPDYAISGKTFLVDNSLFALQKLAQHHRQQMSAKIIAITGSNGKTTTKELIFAVLKRHFNTIATSGNLNNHIGVPLSLLNIKPETDFAIIEMGANHQGEIDTLCDIAVPDFGLITNVGKAHLEGFGSFEGVKSAKAELYKSLKKTGGTVLINMDNPVLWDMLEQQDFVSYSFTSKEAFCYGRVFYEQKYIGVEWQTKHMAGKCLSRIQGSYNAENILAAICTAAYLNVPREITDKAISNYIPGNQRSEIKVTEKNTLFLDMYNANPSSMELAIKDFHNAEEEQVLIIGDMKELGNESMLAHREILDMINQLGFKRVYLSGPEFYKLKHQYNFRFFEDTEGLANWLKKNNIQDKQVFIKGSRAMQLEKVIPYL